MSGYTAYVSRYAMSFLPISLIAALGQVRAALKFSFTSSFISMALAIITAGSVYRKYVPGLYIMSIVYATISLAEMANGLTMASIKETLRGSMVTAFKVDIDYYGLSKASLMDDIQNLFSCCGIFLAEVDWFRYSQLSNNSLPASCCNGTTTCLTTARPPCIPLASDSLEPIFDRVSNCEVLSTIAQVVSVFISLSLIQIYSAKS